MFLPIFLSFSNQNFLISSVCMCLSVHVGPYCLGLFSSSLDETKNITNISMPFTQKIRHFLSWVACTLKKAKVVGDPGTCENWRWTLVSIAETGRKSEWQEFYITLKVRCYFHLSYKYARNQSKLEKNPKRTNTGNFLPNFSLFVSTSWAAYRKHRNET